MMTDDKDDEENLRGPPMGGAPGKPGGPGGAKPATTHCVSTLIGKKTKMTYVDQVVLHVQQNRVEARLEAQVHRRQW